MHEVARRGYVLIGVLLLLLAGTGVAHTLLAMAQSEFFVSRARWDVLIRRFAAETGRNLTARALTGTDSLPQGKWVSIGSGSVPPRARYDARVVRLSREVLLIHSEGSVATAPGSGGQVGLYWAMDPVARVSAARGIVESGGPVQLEAGSSVDATLIRDTPAPWRETSCDHFAPDIDALFMDGLSPRGELHEDPRAELGGEPVSRGLETRLPSLGLLGHDALIEGANVQVSEIVSPEPLHRLGRCAVASVTNWGAPLDSANPCAEHRPVVRSEGSVTVDGGQGQGILLVSGDATFRSEFHYYGLVVVGGDLEITEESEIYGLVRVRGAVSLSGRSRIVGSVCAALSALDAATQLRELAPIPGSAWPDSR